MVHSVVRDFLKQLTRCTVDEEGFIIDILMLEKKTSYLIMHGVVWNIELLVAYVTLVVIINESPYPNSIIHIKQ